MKDYILEVLRRAGIEPTECEFEDFEKKREEDYNNSMSKIMLSNVQKEGDYIPSLKISIYHMIP